MRRASWAVRQRLDDAEAEVAERWNARSVAVIGEELRTAPRSIQQAVMERLSDLQQRGAWKGDIVEMALREIADVSAEIAARVRARLGMGEAHD